MQKHLLIFMITFIFAVKSEDIYSNSWAVIIGIDNYENSEPLKYAVNDAHAVKELLLSKFGYKTENIKYLTDEKATAQSIKKSLYGIAKKAGKNDRVIVFYSGHGQTLTETNDHGYIIPYEGDYLKGVVIGKKFPWYDVRVNDMLNLH